MTPGPRAVLTLNLTAIGAALLLCQPVAAQTEPAAADKGLERAQKAADAVFHWIKLNGDKGANRQAPAAAPAAPAPAPVARKPAAAPTPVAAAPKPAPAPVTAAAPVAAPPVVAAAAPAPEPERPLLLAAAEPTPAPTAPMVTAARAVEPPPPPPQAEEEAEVPLKLLTRVNPGIPRQLQQTSFRDGFARVKFTVAPNGSISKAEVIGASHSRLGTSAVEAVKQWKFAPIPAAREVAIEFAFNNLDE